VRVEEQYPDVCQNIEFGIVMAYRDCPGLADANVMRALEALIDAYVAEKIGRPPRTTGLSKDEELILGNMRSMCEWRLGRKPLTRGNEGEEFSPSQPQTVDVILLCLKRILKSVKKWNREYGMRGYLSFIVRFVR
jgi:hypothetical protein